MATATPRQARARLAATVRHHGRDTAAANTAAADLRRVMAERYISELVASTPPLSDADRLALTRLLTM